MNIYRKKTAISRIAAAVIIIVIIVVAAAGVAYLSQTPSTSSTSSSSSTAAIPKILTMDVAEFPALGLSPTGNNYPNWYYTDVYQPLINLNDSLIWSTGQVQYLPALADNWTVSSNGTVYTLNLRQGVTFSNGDPFNAYQVWAYFYTLYYMSGNSSGFDLGYNVYYDQMANVNFGPATIALLTASGLTNPTPQVISMMENASLPIYITGQYQVVFRLQNAFEWFPALLVPAQIWDMQWEFQNGGPGTPAVPSTFMESTSAPGTGPYTVSGYSADAYVQYSQNPAYWGKNLTASQVSADVLLDPGHVATVLMQYKTDDVVRYTDLTTGAAQIADILAADWPSITASPNTFSYVESPPWSSTAFGVALNTQLYPTNITAVRQAIVHAINYTDLIDTALGGEGVVGVAPEYPSFSQFYDLGNLTAYSYNMTEAVQILQAAKIDTSTLPPITLQALSACTWCIASAQVIQEDLAQLNLTVKLNLVLSSNYYDYAIGPYSEMVNESSELGNVNFVCALSATPDAFTPADAWTTFVSNQSELCNLAVYNNPIVQDCVNSWFNGTSIADITTKCTAAQQQIYGDAPYVFLVPRLWWIDGSTVWLKSGPVASFYMDPEFSGIDTEPFINTVTFK